MCVSVGDIQILFLPSQTEKDVFLINVALVNPFPVVSDALEALLKDSEDIEICGVYDTLEGIIKSRSPIPIHIVLMMAYTFSESMIDDMKLVLQHFPKSKMLVLSLFNDEKFILRSIKAGAKGHLGSDANRSEIL